MGTKAEELANPKGCLSKAADDEPIFILRANDPIAPAVVRIWASLAMGTHERPKRFEAFALSKQMEDYRARKGLGIFFKDPDWPLPPRDYVGNSVLTDVLDDHSHLKGLDR